MAESMRWTMNLMRFWTSVISSGSEVWRSFTRAPARSEEHTSELQSLRHLVCRLLLETDTATTEIYTLSLHDALPILDDELDALLDFGDFLGQRSLAQLYAGAG